MSDVLICHWTTSVHSFLEVFSANMDISTVLQQWVNLQTARNAKLTSGEMGDLFSAALKIDSWFIGERDLNKFFARKMAVEVSFGPGWGAAPLGSAIVRCGLKLAGNQAPMRPHAPWASYPFQVDQTARYCVGAWCQSTWTAVDDAEAASQAPKFAPSVCGTHQCRCIWHPPSLSLRLLSWRDHHLFEINVWLYRCNSEDLPVWITVSRATLQNSDGSVLMTLHSTVCMPLRTSKVSSLRTGKYARKSIVSN